MYGPDRYVQWMNSHLGFNPRGASNSNALSEYLIEDLRSASPDALKGLLDSGSLKAVKNANVPVGDPAFLLVRNIDLVLTESTKAPTPVSVQLSVEHKTIMTAHGKARKNRYGDIIAYASHMHNHRRDCIVGATIVINTSEAYENPDSFAKGLERPKLKMENVVAGTMRVFDSIPLRDNPTDAVALPEALAIIIVNYDGINPASLVKELPDASAPSHYHNFIKRLAQKYQDRFCR